MGQFVDLTSSDGFVAPAWVAKPEGTPRGAVVVLQEIFGVNSHIRSVADRYAASGYLAVAPSTFHRVKQGIELGHAGVKVQQVKVNAFFLVPAFFMRVPDKKCFVLIHPG